MSLKKHIEDHWIPYAIGLTIATVSITWGVLHTTVYEPKISQGQFVISLRDTEISQLKEKLAKLEIANTSAAPTLTPQFLTNVPIWYWQYSPRGWYTRGSFRVQGGILHFTGETDCLDPQDAILKTIFYWQSTGPLDINVKEQTVTFAAKQIISPLVLNIPSQHLLPGTQDGVISLSLTPILEGTWTTLVNNQTTELGINFNRKP